MSRIGKKPVPIPEGVTAKKEGRDIVLTGPKGTLRRTMPPESEAEIREGAINVISGAGSRRSPAYWGLARALIAAAVEGVSSGFEKKLEIEGIGYRATMADGDLEFLLGFSHPVRVPAPEGISFKVEKNAVTISGMDKELVGNVAAKIRKLRPPEPYKGKGIRYAGEVIRRKQGKKAVAGG